MSQIRQDLTTQEWVIIASERARRPRQFAEKKPPQLPEYEPSCPFCPGNEKMTPPEVSALRNKGRANQPGWRVRVVPNKFPALSPISRKREPERKLLDGFFRQMEGAGKHEVLIETPKHNQLIPELSYRQAEEMVLMLRDRYRALRELEYIRVIVIFKNQGIRAGTSIVHPHWQIVATPIVPQSLRRRLAVATRYWDDNGGCLYCDLIEAESKSGQRVIEEDNDFIVFQPFASRSPFETWILLKEHSACFGHLSDRRAKALGRTLKRTLTRLYKVLDHFDYNIVIYTAPIRDEEEEYFHWYLRIVPRLSMIAGFEIGSGIFINTALPEETAKVVRRVKI